MQNSPAPFLLRLSVLCLFAFLMTSFVLYRMDYFEAAETEEWAEIEEESPTSPSDTTILPSSDTFVPIMSGSKSGIIMSGSKSAVVPKTKKTKVKKTPKNKKVTIMTGSKSGEIIPSSKSAPIFDSDDIIPSSKSGMILRPDDVEKRKKAQAVADSVARAEAAKQQKTNPK